MKRATLLTQLDTLITWLECGDEERPAVFGSRRMPCRVLGRTDFFASSDLDVVWWQVLSLRGDDIALDEVRAWLDLSLEGQAQEPAKHAAVITDERVQRYYWGELPTGRCLSGRTRLRPRNYRARQGTAADGCFHSAAG